MEEHENKRRRLNHQDESAFVAPRLLYDGVRVPSPSVNGVDNCSDMVPTRSGGMPVHNSRYGSMRIAGKAQVHNGDNTGVHHHHYNTSSTKPSLDANKAVFRALKASLVFSRMDARLRNVLPPLPMTCNWLFQHEQYREWNDCSGVKKSDRFLWIKGKPGSGKSTVMKTAFNKASKKSSEGIITISYFFNARAIDGLEKSSLGLYRSMVHQILCKCPDFESIFFANFSAKYQGGMVEEWTENELRDFLVDVMQDSERPPICLFIDALDEGEEDNVRNMIAFLEDLVAHVEDACPFQVCLSSRHYPHIHIKGLSIVVEDQKEHNQDIKLYVREKLVDASDKEMDDLRADLCNKAAGVFLWVVLVVPILNRVYEQRKGFTAMKERLERLPQELGGLFTQIIERSSDEIQACISLLQWVLFSTKPLTLSELYLAVQYTESDSPETYIDTPDQDFLDKYILNCSRGLVECSKSEPPVVQFIHETVRGFLLDANGLNSVTTSLAEGLEGECHDKLRNACWSYVKANRTLGPLKLTQYIPTPDIITELDRSSVETAYPFLKYAVEGLLVHAEAAQINDVSQQQFLVDLQSNGNYQTWLCLRNLFQIYKLHRYDEKVTLLYISAEQGLIGLTKVLAQHTHQLNVQCGRYCTALQAASFGGHKEIVQCLLEQGADVNIEGGECRQALIAAIQRGRVDIATMLLKQDAELPLKSQNKALLTMIRQNSEEGVRTLTLKSIDISSENIDAATALIMAIEKNYPQMVELLLQKGIDVNKKLSSPRETSPRRRAWNALQFATGRGMISFVELLIRYGAKDCSEPYALIIAMSSGFVDIYKLLGDGCKYSPSVWFDVAKIAVRVKDTKTLRLSLGRCMAGSLCKFQELPDGERLLLYAVQQGYEDGVQLLLEHGFEASKQTVDGRVAIYEAFKAKYPGIIELFMHHVKNLNTAIRSHNGTTIGNLVYLAASSGDVQIMQALMSRGATVDATFHGQTALYKASSIGSTEAVKILLEYGADVNAGEGVLTPLYTASHNGHTEIVEILLECGADVNAGEGVLTSLYTASHNGFTEIVKILLEYGANINAGEGVLTPLYTASHNSFTEIVEILLECGADVNTDEGVLTPLYPASHNGHTEIVKILLEYGADVNAGEGVLTSLYTASHNGHTEIVKILLNDGANTDPCICCRSPLCAAVSNGDIETVKALLDHGANVDGNEGAWRPLCKAVLDNRMDIVKLLIQNGADVNCVVHDGDTLLEAVFQKWLVARSRPSDTFESLTNFLLLLLRAGAGYVAGQGWDVLLLRRIQHDLENLKPVETFEESRVFTGSEDFGLFLKYSRLDTSIRSIISILGARIPKETPRCSMGGLRLPTAQCDD